MEILRIKVYLTGNIVTEGGADTAVMLPFTGECDSPLFKGKILPGGVDVQRIAHDGHGTLRARYALEGTDDKGQPCRLRHTHDVPRVGDCGAEGMNATERIDQGGIGGSKDHSAGADCGKRLTQLVNTATDRRRSIVTRTANNESIL